MTNIRVYKAVSLFLLVSLGAQAEVSLNGLATHSELGKELFIAGLYTSTPSSDKSAILIAQEEKQIEVRVTAGKLSSRRFKRMWIEGMAVNASPNELKEHSNNMATFANLLKVRMIAGDIFTVKRFSENGNSGVRVSVNGTPLGEIADPRFFDLLLRTWLGPVPLSSEFRSSLTQAGNVDATLLSRFRATSPSDERISEIKSALEGTTQQVAVARPNTSGSVNVPGPNISAPAPPLIAAPPIISAPEASDNTPTENTDVVIAPPTLNRDNLEPGAPVIEEPAIEPAPAAPVEIARAEPSGVLEDEEDSGPILTAESILEQQLFVSKLRKHTYGFLKYPQTALNRGKEGSLRIDVVIDREGNVLQVEIVEESKFRPFNREANKAVKRAAPFPPVPDAVQGETFAFTLPIVFILGDK